MARNLVVLLDGTSNQVEGDLTNVLKLYRMAVKDDEQLVFYHPGVGTVGLVSSWGRIKQKFNAILGLATGWGLDDNILKAYCFLCEQYREGDRIYLFGFSRGAYTARALAGMIYLLGLLRPEQLNLAPYALTAYKRASSQNSLPIAWNFRRIIEGRRVPIAFVGVWDTVASVLVPRPDRLWIPTMEFLPYTKQNPAVVVFRHAAAIDEKRRMFRLYSWAPDQDFQPDPFAEPQGKQDQQTVWFAGDHSDVGGGHPEAESQPAKFPLLWMVAEAGAHGLQTLPDMIAHLGEGKPLPGGRHQYVAPDATAPIHNSMKGFWPLLEWLPKNLKWRRWPTKSDKRGYYLPRSEPRKIEVDAFIHRSVDVRREATRYAPRNLPQDPHYTP
ncbi:DUF2235 domain-containing protein [Sphingomonas montanisoli]|uniref:DUF2235 domain-containing protein n=2 Tax=Sphingomonas montanisoli TaxID=2606412 RepID=A0A5D9C618_9SPHN|nr:DUF2235 domain-containing protein [Sphingomonas montanisoli]